MKIILLFALFVLVGCDDSKICYPSPIIGEEDTCHTYAEWKVISYQNWAGIACMERETVGAAYGDKKYQKALKTCGLREGPSYSMEQIK